MMHESQWPGGPPPPRKFRDAAVRQKTTPSWGGDLKRLTYRALFSTSLTTLLMLLSGTGLLRTQNRTTVDPDATWAAILVVMAACLWVCTCMDHHRADHGFRQQGLGSLLLVGVLMAIIIQLGAMLLWPFVIDKTTSGTTVMAQYGSDPTSTMLVATFTMALFAWCAVCALMFTRTTVVRMLLGFGLLAGVAVLGVWQGIRMLDNPPTANHMVVWFLIAVIGLIVLPVLATAAARSRRVNQPVGRTGHRINMSTWD